MGTRISQKTLLLLHSPLVAASGWSELRSALEAQGQRTIVPDYASVLQAPGPYYAKITDAVRTAVHHAPVQSSIMLVAYSGAGALIPSTTACLPNVCGTIFVDAILPHPGQSWFETASPDLVAHLRSLAVNGRLPPWHEWWPRGAIQAIIANDQLYESFAAELRSLPIEYFEEQAPRVDVTGPGFYGYLRLSEAYQKEADAAEEMGWTVQRKSLNHLAILTHPIEVARAIDIMLAEMFAPNSR